ncbi:MAG: hypothetical protein P8Z42_10440, partial [Anaerolineales bacterium]
MIVIGRRQNKKTLATKLSIEKEVVEKIPTWQAAVISFAQSTVWERAREIEDESKTKDELIKIEEQAIKDDENEIARLKKNINPDSQSVLQDQIEDTRLKRDAYKKLK